MQADKYLLDAKTSADTDTEYSEKVFEVFTGEMWQDVKKEIYKTVNEKLDEIIKKHVNG